MTTLLTILAFLGLLLLLGGMILYSILHGRQVVGGLFGLPDSDEPHEQEPDPERWNFRD